MVSIQNGCPYEIRLHESKDLYNLQFALAAETMLKAALTDKKMKGEWYSVSAESVNARLMEILKNLDLGVLEKARVGQKNKSIHSRGRRHVSLFRGKSPAEIVIERFGGVRKLAAVVGVSPSTITRWNKSEDQRGTGGRIPSNKQQEILRKAEEAGIDLTLEEIIHGSEMT